MKKLIKQEQAITLIALVITIIILLILAGITINLALAPDGIVKRAQEAGDRYTTEQDKEIAGIGELENKLDEIADKIMGNTSDGNEDVDDSVLALKVGDYIKYDTGVSTVGENGVATFRVLYPADSEYGLQIVSNSDLEEVTIGADTLEEAKESYNGAIQNLNSKAEKYINEAYATDARCVGSLPTLRSGKFVDKNGSNETVKLQDTIQKGDILYDFLCYSSGLYNDDTEFHSSEAINKDTGLLEPDSNCERDVEQLSQMNYPFFKYWLASRYIGYNATYEVYGFGLINDDLDWGHLILTMGADIDSNLVQDIRFTPHSVTNGLHPCVALKKGSIKITGGTGEEATPYTIGLK